MAAVLLKVFAAVFLVAVAGVSAQTHHVVGDDNGWGPDLDVNAWLSGRVFSVGDKILFKYSGVEDSVIELKGVEEFMSCNLTNPIKMYTDPVSHVVLEKEGVRYFTSSHPERCKNGMKLPVSVQQPSRPLTVDETPPFNPFQPTPPSPPFDPFPPHTPPPPFVRPPPPPHSAAAYLNGLSLVLFAGLAISYIAM